MSAVQPPQPQPAIPKPGMLRHRPSMDTYDRMKGARIECAELVKLLRNSAVMLDEMGIGTDCDMDAAVTVFLETNLPRIIEHAGTARHLAWQAQLERLKTAEHERARIRRNEYVAKLNAEYDAQKKGAAD